MLRNVVVLAALAAAGCQSAPSAQPARGSAPAPRTSSTLDPCAERLHDISGALLRYCLLNRQMPVQLTEVSAMADIDRPIGLTCPVSGKPYLYEPEGFLVQGKPGRVIVYDPEPGPSGLRWTIMVTQSGSPLTLEVVAVPEEQVAKHLTAPQQ